jgi:hypothetical protein
MIKLSPLVLVASAISSSYLLHHQTEVVCRIEGTYPMCVKAIILVILVVERMMSMVFWMVSTGSKNDVFSSGFEIPVTSLRKITRKKGKVPTLGLWGEDGHDSDVPLFEDVEWNEVVGELLGVGLNVRTDDRECQVGQVVCERRVAAVEFVVTEGASIISGSRR